MATREEYIDKLETQLRDWNDQIDKLQSRAENESQQIKTRIARQLDELKVKRGELKVKLDRIKDSGEDTFDKIKVDAETLWSDVKEGISEVRSILKE